MKRIFLLAVMLLWLPVIVSGQKGQAPTLSLKDLRGRKVRLSAYKGKVVLVNFWATWCPPCRAEMPDLIRLQRQYRSRGLQVIGITYPPENRTDVVRFTKSIKVNYPIVLGSRETKALFDASETLPVTVIIDREGIVRDVVMGILLADEFEQKVKPLLM
jgi:thiol-disulfide isomerase/thioredoxin